MTDTLDLTDELRDASLWTDELVAASGLPVIDVPLVSVGGGLGSFVLADALRIAGLGTEQLRVLTLLDAPYEQYKYLAACSQIPDHERLRSDSASTPDNLWGFPSYAFREAWRDRSLGPLVQVATEPVLADYYTPRAGDVYTSVDREAQRIGWASMRVPGRVRMVRRRHGGGYYVTQTLPSAGSPDDAREDPAPSVAGPSAGSTQSRARRRLFRCRWVHLAVGYPGLRFLDDLQEYRERHRDFRRVVNAYEPHDHVYSSLLGSGGTVLIRGSGIVASRVLQRLLDDVEKKGASTRIQHLFRTYVGGPHGPRNFRRDGGDGFAYQAFNYPKAAWGGQLRERLTELQGKERAELIKTMGGTNTAKRKDWQEQLARARTNGTYQVQAGIVKAVEPGTEGRIATTVAHPGGAEYRIEADFIIDATGLDGDLHDSQLLDDLVTVTGAQKNPLGRLEVTPSFEVPGTRADPGRLYASGSMTLGGIYAPVDSFLGLQYSAIQIVDDLAAQGFVAHIGPLRSVSQWWKWARNRQP